MKCSEAFELISFAVDNQLEEPQKSEFNKHIESCSKCRKLLELEYLIKSYLCCSAHKYSVPEELKLKIISKIRSGEYQAEANLPRAKSINKYLYMIIPIIITFIILYVTIQNHHKHSINLPENNLVRLIYEKFDQALNERYELNFQTSDLSNLQMAITNQTGNKISLPKLDNCILLGGWLTYDFGKKMIHTIYKNGDLLICCTQIDLDELINDSKIIVEKEVIEKLKSGEKYIPNYFNCCSMIMWLEEKNLCVATGEMDAKTLLAHLNK